MQVIQTINDTIRILFSPIDEDFKLLDFLLVQEGKNKYLAQIIEIYDDKYDASQNVARVKLFFKVNDEGEVFSYDHFTPSKECEIKKIKREEILTFVNENRESLTIGMDYATQEPLDINVEFLKNNAVIFADKIEHSNNISAHFASTLSRYNFHSVIFDFTGAIDVKNAKKLKISKDIKLPLNFYTINYIWEKGLKTASLETQAICREIFNEVQTYAKNAPEGFIPFKNFLKVVEIQYKATPIAELTVLLNKLKAYQKNDIFANTKGDFESAEISCRENEITIIDFSELKTSWHKEFCDFIIRNVKDAFVFIRLNETNSDVDLINFIYDKNPQIHFIPSVSYSYSKMPHIIERADNFILLPTLSPKRDFGAANFELSSISSDECILFGKDSENFIFTIINNRFASPDNSEKNPPRKIKLKLDINTHNPKERLRTNIGAEPDSAFEQQAKEPVLTDEELEFFEQQAKENLDALEEKIPIKKPQDCSTEPQSCSREENPSQETEKDGFDGELKAKEDNLADSLSSDTAQEKETIQTGENLPPLESDTKEVQESTLLNKTAEVNAQNEGKQNEPYENERSEAQKTNETPLQTKNTDIAENEASLEEESRFEEENPKDGFTQDRAQDTALRDENTLEESSDEYIAWDNTPDTASDEENAKDNTAVSLKEDTPDEDIVSEDFTRDDYITEPAKGSRDEIIEGEILEEETKDTPAQNSIDTEEEPLSELARAIREEERNVSISLDDEIQINKNYSAQEVIDIRGKDIQRIDLETAEDIADKEFANETYEDESSYEADEIVYETEQEASLDDTEELEETSAAEYISDGYEEEPAQEPEGDFLTEPKTDFETVYEEDPVQEAEEDPLQEEPEETEQGEESLEKSDEEQEEEPAQTQENRKIIQSSFQNILEQEDDSESSSEEESEKDDTLSLEALAAQSVENAFNEVMDSQASEFEKPKKDLSGKLVVNENVVIDLEKIKEHIDTKGASELPIFKNTSAKKEPKNFKAGDIIEHDKYGAGEVVKVINYANRSLLQINFKEVGKRLLDPDIANIRELKQD